MLEALGIDLKELIFAIVNFLILVGVLGKFLYKPFLNALHNRTQTIQDAYDNADATNRKAEEKYEAYTKKLARAEDEARNIIKQAKLRADEQAAMIVEEAKNEAARIREQTKKDIEREKEQAVMDARSQITDIALLAASRIVEKEIDAEGQERIIDSILEKAGEGTWQN